MGKRLLSGDGGSEKSTIYEVAKRAGVSIASVSRTLHGQGGISEATRERIREAMRELHYVPSGAARGLAGTRLGVIGLIFPDLDDPSVESGHETLLYSDEVIRGAERAARAEGHAILIAATHSSSGRELALSVAGKVDALVVMARSVRESDVRLLASRVPTVLLAGGRRLSGIDYVGVDNYGGAYAATAHLVEHGYRDIAFVAGPKNSPDARERFAGFRDALAAADLSAPERPEVHGDFTEHSGGVAMTELLRLRRRLPRAVVVGNDQMAVGARALLAELGLSVPGDVALSGFDDIQLARHIAPSLTTVRQPMRELGEACVRLLLRRLDDAAAERQVIEFPTRLVIRQSCGCLGDRVDSILEEVKAGEERRKDRTLVQRPF
ncbi:MAG: LacI family DNA-binding transcriptional regulator [Gaiellaceae bacterium]